MKSQKRKFLGPVPHFGTKHKRAPISKQEQSPYYWWWAYLKRNKQYLSCCERGGKGPFAKLYEDFGDVRDDDFKKWWDENERGRTLFAEQSTVDGVVELVTKDEWKEVWSRETTLVMAIPLSWGSKRDLQKRILRLLRLRHKRKRGKTPLRGKATSDARYPLERNYHINSLKRALMVYDAVEIAKTLGIKKSYYNIGCDLKLVPTAMPSKYDESLDRRDANKVNVMTVNTSRLYKRALRTIANVGKGVFP